VSEEIFCPRCRSDGIGRALLESCLERDDDKDNSYLKYECDNCGCVFLIKDDYISPGERAERSVIVSMLNEGMAPTNIAKELNIDREKVSKIVKELRKSKTQKRKHTCL
jgi:transposase-like protein